MDEYKKKDDLQKQKEIQSSGEEFKVTSFSLEDFLGDDYKESEPVSEEQQIKNDLFAGAEIISKNKIQDEWEIVELESAKTLDEVFEEARRTAHKHEKNVSKIKKSTLKKRREEYARKNEEHTAMREAQKKLKEFRENKVRTQLKSEFIRHSEKMGQSLGEVQEKVTSQAMDAVMYFQKREGLGVDDMSLMFRDLCFDTRKIDKDSMKKLSEEKRKTASDQFAGKMALYEKLFSEALSWDPQEFAIKDNHTLALDPNFSNKMEKLSLVPILKRALDEYSDIVTEGKMGELRKNEARVILSPELMNELAMRLAYYEDVQIQMENSMDLMANDYYALLGKSDTANLKMDKLAELGDLNKANESDMEMTRYFNAIYRSRVAKNNGNEIKGKNPSSILDKLRKLNGLKTGKKARAATAEGIEAFTLAHKVAGKRDITSRRSKAIAGWELTANNFEFQNEELIDFQIDNVHKDIKIELTKEQKDEIRTNFRERFAYSQRAGQLLVNNEERRKDLQKRLEARLLKEFPQGLKEQVREEREGILEYLLSPKFKSEDEQYKVYRTVMLPIVDRSFIPMGEFAKEDAAKATLEIFRNTLKNDNQLEILSKYKTPQEFAKKATQEEFNRLMQLRHIGGWVNNLIFEKKDEAVISLMGSDGFKEYKDLYVKLAKGAYGFCNAVLAEVKLMGNVNYSFMTDADIEKLLNVRPGNNSLEYIKNSQIMVKTEEGNYRLGENVSKRLEDDEKLFYEKPELWTAFAKYNKDAVSLYRENSYIGEDYVGFTGLSEFGGMTDQELEKKHADTEKALLKSTEALKAAKDLITPEFKASLERRVRDHIGYSAGKNLRMDQVAGDLQELKEKVKIRYDTFLETGAYSKRQLEELDSELDAIIKSGDVFLLPLFPINWQSDVWEMVSMIRPILNYANEMEEYEEAQDEDFLKPEYESIKEDFEDELSDLKKDALAQAKEADPALKAYLEAPEYERAVEEQGQRIQSIEHELAKREKPAKAKKMMEGDELKKRFNAQYKLAEKKQDQASEGLRDWKFYSIPHEAMEVVKKYSDTMQDIEELDPDTMTKEFIEEIAGDFQSIKKLIEDDKNGIIFAMEEGWAEEIWKAYYTMAPVAAYAKNADAEPDFDKLQMLKRDETLTVNREDAESKYRGRLLANEQDRKDFDFIKEVLEFHYLYDFRMAVEKQ